MINTNPGASFTVYVAHSSLTDDDFSRIRAGVSGGRCDVVSVPVSAALFGDVPLRPRLSKETYYRLYAAKYLPGEVGRVLYLDPDVAINGSLAELYNLDLGGKIFAAANHNLGVINFFNVRRLKMDPKSLYVNAGVILMDLAVLRERRRVEEVFEYIEKYGKRTLLEDQDVFNAVYDGDIVYIDKNLYNMDEVSFSRLARRIGAGGAINFARSKTVIVHFNGKNKPWNPGYKGSLAEFFEKNRMGGDPRCSICQNAGRVSL